MYIWDILEHIYGCTDDDLFQFVVKHGKQFCHFTYFKNLMVKSEILVSILQQEGKENDIFGVFH